MPRHLLLLLALASLACAKSVPANPDVARWEAKAAKVTITRDDWGVPHIHGATDADAVFGLMYAQAEDDFNRIEVNYLNSQGRLSEAYGETAIWRDLRQKLFIQPDSMKALYAKSPAPLQALMTAWADGLNYFLFTHPSVKPLVLTHFEPWMALTFSEGSIGGDIESISLQQLEAFYGGAPGAPVTTASLSVPREPTGSNGFAIAPSKTASKHALLLINPHTSFFFRAEVQVQSDEGLNAYGAVTWGQFFVYQGFNAKAGWMHTSSGADVIDEYAETIVEEGGKKFYRYAGALRPLLSEEITLPYKAADGMTSRKITVYRTHHGPVVRGADGKYISVRLMNEPVAALTQSYGRTKSTNLADFRKTMELHTNSSNNTIFADAEGNIAYFHANHIPRRTPTLDWSKPVNGADSTTEWGPVHGIDESPLVVNPANGWIQNTNNWPYSAAGKDSPKAAAFPKYMDGYGENPRGIHAIRVLSARNDFTLATLRDAAFDTYLPALADLVPTLLTAYDNLPASDPQKAKLAKPIAALRGWDYRWAAASVPTTLAIYWGDELWTRTRVDAEAEAMAIYAYMAMRTTPAQRLEAFSAIVDQLTADFGTWETPWGDVNRFQRLTGDIEQPFTDSGASIPVPFATARWGSLASFGARTYPGTKKRYGTSGNSFVAVVEFGDSVHAMAVTAGGENSVPTAKHFNDQAGRYAAGDLREVYFYPAQLQGHIERTYQPGKEAAK